MLQLVSAVPANLRLANQTALLSQLLGRKAASRAELAKATGMSKPTIAQAAHLGAEVPAPPASPGIE